MRADGGVKSEGRIVTREEVVGTAESVLAKRTHAYCKPMATIDKGLKRSTV